MMDDSHSQQRRVDPAPSKIAPAVPCYQARKGVTEDSHKEEVVSVLPLNEWVVPKVADIGLADLLFWLHNHPAYVAPEQALLSVVRVAVRVNVAMVYAMSTRPPENGALYSAGAS